MARRKTEKMVEIHEFYVIRSGSEAAPVPCGDCSSDDSIMVTPEQAALVARVPVRTIYRWAEAGLIHYQEQPGGEIVVCLKSLPITINPFERK